MEAINSQQVSLIKSECAQLGIDISQVSETDPCPAAEVYRLRLESLLLNKKLANLEAKRRQEKAVHKEKMRKLREKMLKKDEKIEEKDSIISAISEECNRNEDLSSDSDESDVSSGEEIVNDNILERARNAGRSRSPIITASKASGRVHTRGNNAGPSNDNGRSQGQPRRRRRGGRMKITAIKAYSPLHHPRPSC